jgi:hypothetical protein
MVEVGDREDLAETFDHDISVTDQDDRDDTNFNTKAERVVNELWVSLPCKKFLISIHRLYFAFS